MVELIEAQYVCSLTSAHYGYKMTGHHISYRGSMVNWSPIGRNANSADRELFTTADIKHNIRTKSFNKLIKREELTEKLAFSLGDKPLYDKINQVNPGCAIETSGPTETIKLIQGIISSIEGSSDWKDINHWRNEYIYSQLCDGSFYWLQWTPYWWHPRFFKNS